MPSFPIWADEWDASYPFEGPTPWASGAALEGLPSYATTEVPSFPSWKKGFIRSNRGWLASIRPYAPDGWFEGLQAFPSSLRKLEWNCQGEDRNLWKHVLQFRPSGLRAKRYVNSPSLVAIGNSQVPVLGPERRHLTRVEGLRLQGFPDFHHLPDSRSAAFRALGNAVHVGVAREVATRLLSEGTPVEDAFLESEYLAPAPTEQLALF